MGKQRHDVGRRKLEARRNADWDTAAHRDALKRARRAAWEWDHHHGQLMNHPPAHNDPQDRPDDAR